MAEDAVSELAQRLREFKERTGRSYTGLAARTALSRSTVHRYCSGTAVAPDFDSVSRLARACGADRDELLDLHRIWALASAAARDGGADQPPRPEPALRDGAADDTPATAAGVGPAARLEVPRAAPPVSNRRPRSRRYLFELVIALVAALCTLIALQASAGFGWPGDRSGSTPGSELEDGTAGQVLFSEACAPVISLGERDECVQQVQALLSDSGTTLTVDANFSLDTLRRIMAFQILAGLPPTGTVDDATKHALVSGRVSMRTWSDQRVERRIREVFRDAGAGDEAVYIARCRSHLDALWVDANPGGGHNWGVFQLTDAVLSRYDGTPHTALDPEWNIQAAHWIWAEHRDFRGWAMCVGSSGSPSPFAARASSAGSTPPGLDSASSAPRVSSAPRGPARTVAAPAGRSRASGCALRTAHDRTGRAAHRRAAQRRHR